MRTRRMHYATITDRARYDDVEPLPFLPHDVKPACARHADIFALAAGETPDGRATSYETRTQAVQAEQTAKRICGWCPVTDACREFALSTFQTWGVWGATSALEREAWWREYGLTPQRRSDNMPRDKFKDVPTIPLFSDAQLTKPKEQRTPRQKSVAVGKCPSCTKTTVGLIRQGRHIVWRQHYYTTWGGATRLCAASFVAACVAQEPAAHAHGAHPVQCPHQGEGSDDATPPDAA